MLALGFMGNMVQSNAIGNAFESAFNIPAWTMGIAVAAIAVVIFIGGVKRIASVTEKLVPFMALLYIVGALIVIFANVTKIPGAFGQIFVGAFNPQAVTGGVMVLPFKKRCVSVWPEVCSPMKPVWVLHRMLMHWQK